MILYQQVIKSKWDVHYLTRDALKSLFVIQRTEERQHVEHTDSDLLSKRKDAVNMFHTHTHRSNETGVKLHRVGAGAADSHLWHTPIRTVQLVTFSFLKLEILESLEGSMSQLHQLTINVSTGLTELAHYKVRHELNWTEMSKFILDQTVVK